jgi:hypothetical protein
MSFSTNTMFKKLAELKPNNLKHILYRVNEDILVNGYNFLKKNNSNCYAYCICIGNAGCGQINYFLLQCNQKKYFIVTDLDCNIKEYARMNFRTLKKCIK